MLDQRYFLADSVESAAAFEGGVLLPALVNRFERLLVAVEHVADGQDCRDVERNEEKRQQDITMEVVDAEEVEEKPEAGAHEHRNKKDHELEL